MSFIRSPPRVRISIAWIWQDHDLDAENLPQTNIFRDIAKTARADSQSAIMRDSLFLEKPKTARPGRCTLQGDGATVPAIRPHADHPSFSYPKEREPDDAEDQDGKAGGNRQEREDRRPRLTLARLCRVFDDPTVLLRCHSSLNFLDWLAPQSALRLIRPTHNFE
jgi:hypothetical protein